MRVKQLSIFLENRLGRLAEVARVLGDAGINIRALSLADTADFGILRLIVNDPEKAHTILQEAGYTSQITDVVAVEVDDRPGGLRDVMDVLEKAGINVEYMYAFVARKGERALLVFRFEDIEGGIKALESAGVRVLEAREVYSM